MYTHVYDVYNTICALVVVCVSTDERIGRGYE